MSRDTNFSGHPVLSQIIKLIKRDKVNELATTTKVNRYVKSFDAFTHLVVMIYAALSGAKSIRQVVEGFEANVTRLNHLGIAYLVRRSTLSDANKKRTSQFFGDVYKALYQRYSPLLSDSKASKALQKGLYILDSTTISLFSQILKGVGRTPKNNKKKGGIKAHTLLEASCVLPSFVDYSAAAIHDHSRMSSILSLPSGSFATFDMGYVDYWMWKQFTDHDIFFVTRQKDKISFTVIENITCSSDDDIVSDQKISVVYRHTTERELTEEEMNDGKRHVTVWRMPHCRVAVAAQDTPFIYQKKVENFIPPLFRYVNISHLSRGLWWASKNRGKILPKDISPQHDKKSNKINSHELPVNALERLRVFMAIQAKRKGRPMYFSLCNGKGRIAIAWPSVLYAAKR